MKTLRNSVQLIGNVGQDINFQKLDNGTAYAKFSLATNEFYRNNKGEKVKETQWHNVIAWGKTAEYINESVKKGNEVVLQGKLKYSSYEGKDGIKRYSCDVVVNEFLKVTKESVPF
jgi:single-strand DNA-binding protein